VEKIRIGIRLYELGKYSEHYRFLDEQDGTWIDIVTYPSSDELADFWNSLGGSQWYMGERDWNYWVFSTSKSERDNAVNSVFRGEKVLFNVGTSLSFSTSSDSFIPSDDQLQYLLERIDQTAGLTRQIVRNMVSKEDRVMLPSVDGTLTKVQRAVGFIQLWTKVKYNYPFFDRVPHISWDSVLHRYLPEVEREQSTQEYYGLLQRLLASLHDGHTGIWVPKGTFDLFGPPIRIRRVEGKVLIIDIDDELKSSGLKPGMAITHVDDKPVNQVLEESYYPYMPAGTQHYRDLMALGTCVESSFPTLLQGNRISTADIRVEDVSRVVQDFKLKRTMFSEDAPWYFRNLPIVEYERLEGDISYVALNTFRSEHVVAEFDKVFPQIRSSKGLIIDVRENGGGMSGLAYQIIGRLTDQPLPNGRWKSRKYIPSFHAWGKPEGWYEAAHDPEPLPLVEDPYLGPIVILAGPLTGSAAENFLVPFQAGGRAVLVGEKTAGHVGNPLVSILPGGAESYIVTMSSTYPDGKEYDGIGVIPDVEVANTRSDVALGRDRVLETGLEILRQSID
jgi:C-terminal processing protease CtpA/Prc